MKLTLREYQAAGVDAIRDKFARSMRRVGYVAPTGSGKTALFSHITERSASLGKRVLIVVHRRELVKQASDKLTDIGLPHGIIAPGHSMSSFPVQVGSVQTIVRRDIKAPDLIVIDEAHHVVAGNQWGSVVEDHPDAFVLGVTATPCRLDGRGLGRKVGGYFDSLVLGPSVTELIDAGWLAPFDVYAPRRENRVDMDGAKMRGGDWAKDDMEVRADRGVITGCAILEYARYGVQSGERRPALAFCVSVKHAEHVCQDFSAAGYRSACIHGGLGVKDRDDILVRLAGGELDVVTACDVISEGVDVPGATVAILLRPTKSLGVYLQQVGRVLRPKSGKRAVILDHSGNCFEHGLPDQERRWDLNTEKTKRRRKDGEAPVRQCPMCYRVHDPSPRCPGCGYVYPVTARGDVEYMEGELEKVTAENVRKDLRREQGKARTLQELMALAARTGRSKAWARFVWRSRVDRRQGSVGVLPGSGIRMLG